jgi:MFS family permease
MLKKDPYAALRLPEFRNFILARLAVTIGSQMMAVIVGWQVYELTKDPLSLGLIGLAEVIPAILISLYAGHKIDSSDRKKIIVSSYAVIFISACLLLYLSTVYTGVLGTYKLFGIYSMIAAGGFARGFLGPANTAFLSQVVPNELLPNAITWNTSNWQFGAVSGPALGGLIYGFFGVTTAYLFVTGFILTALILISFIKKKPAPAPLEEMSLKDKLTVGIRFVFNNKIMLGALSLDMFAVLFGGAVALLPIFSGEILKSGPQGLGILRAAPSIGAVIMALVMTRRSPIKNAGRNLLTAVAGFGLCIITFALSRNFYLSLTMLALSGMFDSVSVVIRSTIIQLQTPENMKGRVSAVNGIFIGSSNEIGAFESGVAARLIGLVPSVIFGGIMTLLITGIVGFSSEKMRKLRLG